jgi:hypothetical protein
LHQICLQVLGLSLYDSICKTFGGSLMVAASAAAAVVVVVLAVTVMVVTVLVVLAMMAVVVLATVMADLIGYLHPCRLVDQPFCRLLVTVEDYILDALEQLWLDLVIDLKHGRVDYGHIHAGFDRMV